MEISNADLTKIVAIQRQYMNEIRSELLDPEDTYSQAKHRYYTPKGVRKVFIKRGFTYPSKTKIIALSNLKGGVGKTSIACALAQKCASLGFKTLLIDADKQANATSRFLKATPEYTLFHVVTKQCTFKKAIVNISESFDILPSSLINQKLEAELLKPSINKTTFFRKNLEGLKYDIVIIDTEPNLSQINFMGIAGADLNLTPVRLDKDSIDGVRMIIDFIDEAKVNFPDIVVQTKALINFFDGRLTTTLQKIGEICDGMISSDTSFMHYQDHSELPTNSKALKDISKLAFSVTGIDEYFEHSKNWVD
jgi:chromosome partitioning protein